MSRTFNGQHRINRICFWCFQFQFLPLPCLNGQLCWSRWKWEWTVVYTYRYSPFKTETATFSFLTFCAFFGGVHSFCFISLKWIVDKLCKLIQKINIEQWITMSTWFTRVQLRGSKYWLYFYIFLREELQWMVHHFIYLKCTR